MSAWNRSPFSIFPRMSTFLAWRSIWRGSVSVSVLTIAMLVLVFLNLLFVPALLRGVVDQANRQLVRTLTGNVVVLPAEGQTALADAASVREQLLNLNHVEHVSLRQRAGTEVISVENRSGNFVVEAIDPIDEERVLVTHEHFIEGSSLAAGDRDQIVLGAQVAGAELEDLEFYAASLKNVHAGDQVRVKLMSGQFHIFTVKGIFRVNFPQSDLRGYITRADLDRLMPTTQNVATSMLVKTADGQEQAVINQAQDQLDGVQYQMWSEQAGIIRAQVQSFNLVNNLLSVVALTVGAITIVIITYVDIVNKRRQIGIERAIGIGGGVIVMSYVLKALVFSLIGSVLGSLIFLYVVVPFVQANPFSFPSGPVTLSVDTQDMLQKAWMMLIVGALAALLPAWNAVRTHLVDAIWGPNN
jgi:putative ABC transport system permease protein